MIVQLTGGTQIHVVYSVPHLTRVDRGENLDDLTEWSAETVRSEPAAPSGSHKAVDGSPAIASSFLLVLSGQAAHLRSSLRYCLLNKSVLPVHRGPLCQSDLS
jgi:hypothetical protein